MLIPLKEYAERLGKSPDNARQAVWRGSFKTAQKIGRQWFVDDAELWPDHRVKSGKYIGAGGQAVEKHEIIELYRRTGSLRATAAIVGAGTQAVRRILIEANEYTSPQSTAIAELLAQGLTQQEIAKRLGLSYSTVNSYAPYERGTHIAGRCTQNALRIRRYRAKKRAEEAERKGAAPP